MWNELFAVIAPVILIAGIGAFWAKSGSYYPAEFIGRIVMNIGAPALVINTFSRIDSDFGALQQVMLVALVVLVVLGVIGVTIIRLMKVDLSTFLPTLLFPNSGNMGLPLCLFAFGERGLALAMVFFLVMLVAHFTLGIAVVTHGRGSAMERIKEQARQPILYAFVIGLCVAIFEWSLPVWISNTVGLLAGLTIPMMLLTLGVSLVTLKVSDWPHALVFSVIRVLGSLLVAWLACEWLSVDDVVTRGVILLQATMPAAVFNYILALRYERNPQAVAGVVVMSTVISLMIIPVVLSFYL